MFNKRINSSELISNPSLLSDMTDGDVYQIVHRGDTRVILTQDDYFDLMARLEKREGTIKTTRYDPNKLMSDFENQYNLEKK